MTYFYIWNAFRYALLIWFAANQWQILSCE